MALAQAIAEYIHDVTRARTIFSTHYHELAKLALTRPRIKNLRMEVWEDGKEVVFLYKVAEGAADRSYGIHVARLAGLPKSVLERAKLVLKDLEPEQPYQQLRLDGFFLAEPSQQAQEPGPGKATAAKGPLRALSNVELVGGCAAREDALNDSPEFEILREIESAELAHMTPFEALNRLVEWQARLRKEK